MIQKSHGMRVLLTGASSFTGFWFARALAEAGHEVVMPLRRELDGYNGVREERVRGLARYGTVVEGCAFGSDRFLEVIDGAGSWDALCHHAAQVENYKSPDFDVAAALANNTRGLARVLDRLQARGCRQLILTGTVFEPGEGAGSDELPAVSPYGLSKALTADMFRYYARIAGLHLGKFVIPNPFGPYEEPRFTRYLVRTWMDGRTAAVKTPLYVRDNIHVSLLAHAYAHFVASRPGDLGFSRLNPSGYVESQGSFAHRFADAMRTRLGLPCELTLEQQETFPEPRIRINTDPVDHTRFEWSEDEAWDELSRYYERTRSRGEE